MECPDRATLARLLDGEEPERMEELRAHLEECDRCRERCREQTEMGGLLRRFFSARAESMVREAMPCPSPEEIALYAEGRVPLYRRKEILRHLCACPVCAKAVLDSRSSAGVKEALPPPLVAEAGAVYRKKGRGSRA